MKNIGFKINQLEHRIDKHLIEKFRSICTPHISDNLNRLLAIDSSLRPFHKRGKLVGSAFTVKTRPGDNLLVHKAIDLAQPGDVIVVDAGGETTNSIIGEIMVRMAQKNRIAGFIIDGAIRDVESIKNGTFPVYARAVTHRGPYKDGPGEINISVSIGGMVVHPGDLVVGDEDGLAIVPAEEAEDVLLLAQKQQIYEEEMLCAIEAGAVDRTWIDMLLREKGCEF